MRIVAAREQYEMLEPWHHGRRIVAFDWRPHTGPCPVCGADHSKYGAEEHVAPLENGHQLHVWGWPNEPAIANNWSWAIHDPSRYPEEPSKYEQHGDPAHVLADAGGDSNSQKGIHDYPTREHAMRGAEQAYQQLFPMGGGGSGGHDSGVDYSDLNLFMDHL